MTTITVAVLSLTACSPPIGYAWKLNSDGTVSTSLCAYTRASRLEISYFRDAHPTTSFVAEGTEIDVGEGREVAIAPDMWVVAPPEIRSLADWNSVTVKLLAAPFPEGTVDGNGAAGMLVVAEREIDRGELRVGEWIWDENGHTCELESTEPVIPYDGAMSQQAYRDLLAGNPSLDSLTDALAALDRVAPIIAFQTMLIEDLRGVAADGATVADALALVHPHADPDIVNAAGLAVTRLGFLWDPDVVPGNNGAQTSFPGTIAFEG